MRPVAVTASDLAFAVAFTAGADNTSTDVWLQRLGLGFAAP